MSTQQKKKAKKKTGHLALRRLPLGRAFVLLLLGVGIGVAIFLFHHLRPEEVERRVIEGLRKFLAGDFHFERVELNWPKGVEIHGLEACYPDEALALSARRVSVALEFQLGGGPIVRLVELTDLLVNLRPNADNIPDLPGVLRTDRPNSGEPFPIIVRGQSRLALDMWPDPDHPIPIELACLHLELRPQGNRYELTAEFEGERVSSIRLDGTYDTEAKSWRISHASVKGLTWNADHTRCLARLLPEEGRPPVELAGVADLKLLEPVTGKAPADLLDAKVRATLSELEGKFGNMHTFKAHGLPFQFSSGRCDVALGGRRLKVSNLEATFAGHAGVQGQVLATYQRDFGRHGYWEDWTLTGSGIHAGPEDLEILLPPDVATKIIGPFSPRGTFDFTVSVSNRPGSLEKVRADVNLRDARFTYQEFPYLLTDCTAHIQVETNVARPRGPCDEIRFRVVRGPDVWHMPPGVAVETLCLRVAGAVDTYRCEDGSKDVHEIEIRIANIPFDDQLKDALSARMQEAYNNFVPGGRVERGYVRVVNDAFDERPQDTLYQVQLKDCTAVYQGFPLLLEGVTGTIIKRSSPPLSGEDGRPLPVLEFVNLQAQACDGGSLTVEGAQLENGDLEVIVEAKDLVLGADAVNAVRAVADWDPRVADIWQRLKPSGRVDATIDYNYSAERERLAVTVDLGGHANIAGYEDFDYPVQGLEGEIKYSNKLLEMTGVKGRLGEARVTMNGYTEAEGGAFNVYGEVSGPIEARLLALLDRVFGRRIVPDGLCLTSGTSFGYEVGAEGGTPAAALKNLALRIPIGKTELHLDGGPVRYNGTKLVLEGVKLKWGSTTWLLQGDAIIDGPRLVCERMRLSEDGGTAWVEVGGEATLLDDGVQLTARLRAADVAGDTHLAELFGDGFVCSLGPGVTLNVAQRDEMLPLTIEIDEEGLIRLKGEVELHRADGSGEPASGLSPAGSLTLSNGKLELWPSSGGAPRFTGDIRFKDLQLGSGLVRRYLSGTLSVEECRGAEDFLLRGRVTGGECKVLDFLVEDLRCDLRYEHPILRLSRIDIPFHAGTVGGEIAVDTTDNGGFKVELTARDVELHEMLSPLMGETNPIAGVLDCDINLNSPSSDPRDLIGSVSAEVREGQLTKVPGLRRVIALLSRVAPLGDAGSRFEEATANIQIGGETVYVNSLHLSTATNDVYLRGHMTLYGDLDLVVRPQVTRLIDVTRIINIPVLSKLRDLWHKIAYDIRLGGNLLSRPVLRLRALPWLRSHRVPLIRSPHAWRVRRVRPLVLHGYRTFPATRPPQGRANSLTGSERPTVPRQQGEPR